ncbi:hypothetical protein BCR34DRAFT_665774 [Clohesyomyces aquaticus]|uniref:Necrosis inducing protein-domain-containing protein n=1 Tax=Clohesyomyces aquaticus TaxID=1231657 RepID=A0A1Y1ZFE7_9PLEO|nr:hypothetical protein BCR34DRAFT_665774 [Clohesyomyces aquaticus]
MKFLLVLGILVYVIYDCVALPRPGDGPLDKAIVQRMMILGTRLPPLKLTSKPTTTEAPAVVETPQPASKLVLKSETQDSPIPDFPSRPDGVDEATFYGGNFAFFEEIVRRDGFTDWNPAVVHSPVFLFGRTGPETDPCYPMSAMNQDGTGMNPGTHVPWGPNPGENCNDPGDYHGDYSSGKPFPVYVSAGYCPQRHEWWIDYDSYFEHDGNSDAGHRHDWEGITIVFTPDPNYLEADWWMARGVIFHRHQFNDYYLWKDLMTVSGESDIRDESYGKLLKHPKAFIGLYSHATFRAKCDIGCGSLINAQAPVSLREYRSSDWYRLVTKEDLHLGAEIPAEWDYGEATSTPASNHRLQCSRVITPGFLNLGPAPGRNPGGGPCGHWKARGVNGTSEVDRMQVDC